MQAILTGAVVVASYTISRSTARIVGSLDLKAKQNQGCLMA